MTIYLKEKDLQFFIPHINILLKMGSLTKKTNKQIQRYWRLYYKTTKLINKNNKDFIQKEIYFNKSRLVSKIKKKNTTIKI